MSDIYTDKLQRGQLVTKPLWPLPFLVLEVSENGTPTLLSANIQPTFHRGPNLIHPPTWCHCAAYPAAGVNSELSRDSITVFLSTMPLLIGDFVAVYGSDSASDWFEVTAIEEDRGLTSLTATSIQRPVYMPDGERIQ